MTLNNVSVIMAPNIFMFKGFRSKVTEQQEFSMATSTANIVRLLIRYQNLLWTVRIKKEPTSLLYSSKSVSVSAQCTKTGTAELITKASRLIYFFFPVDGTLCNEGTESHFLSVLLVSRSQSSS